MRVIFALIIASTVSLLAFLAVAWQPAIAPVEPPSPASFASDVVARGEVLAAAGNCATCHSSQLPPYAGGYRFQTPFGVLFSSNITPDPDTGIGRWSEAAFTRAMREGVARNGSHLFPAFPFDHFTKLSDADIKALYAYLMTVPPAKVVPPSNEISFPFNIRALQAAWKALFLQKGGYRPDPARSAEWNRGAYLVEAVAHCGACHTPRNFLGAEQVGHPYGGGVVEGWVAPALDISQSPLRWTTKDYVAYLRGAPTAHGSAFGPMAPVVKGLARLPDSDIQAIATYFSTINRSASPRPEHDMARALAAHTQDVANVRDRGARLYRGACASCHDNGGSGPTGARGDLALSASLWEADAGNFIRVVLDGIDSERDLPSLMMPPFREVMNDDDLAALANYLRRTRTDRAQWSLTSKWVQRIRAGLPPETRAR